MAVIFTGLTLAPGGTATAPTTSTLKVLVLTDSTGAGWRAIIGSDGVASNDAAVSWTSDLRRQLGAEVCVAAFPGQGFNATGNGLVPPLGQTLGYVYLGVARNLAAYDLIICGHGQNDGTGNVTAQITAVVNQLLTGVAGTGTVIMGTPFTGLQKANIQAGIAASTTPARVAFADLSGFTYATTDGLHPDAVSGLAILGPGSAAIIRSTGLPVGALTGSETITTRRSTEPRRRRRSPPCSPYLGTGASSSSGVALSPLTPTHGSTWTGTITGLPTGAALYVESSDDTALTVTQSGTTATLIGVYEYAGSPTIVVQVTPSGGATTPYTFQLTVS